MKLIIQIPCYNEEETLEIALNELPKKIEGIDTIEYLVINDGSLDNTVEVAKKWGVHHIVNFKRNKGLAKGFMAGIDACLKEGSDIIVNTDADNQYCGKDIEKLVSPILNEKADIVVGNDSSPVHIASGFEKPFVIGIFGPGKRALGFFPWTEKSNVIEDNEFYENNIVKIPKKRHEYRKDYYKGIPLISADRVFKEIMNHLEI